LIRELRRKLPYELLSSTYEADFVYYEKVLPQKPNSKNKIYSLHEPGVYCMAKGKDHVQYEYGNISINRFDSQEQYHCWSC